MCNTLHQQIEKAAAAREDVRVKGKQQGWDEDRCEDEARALKDKQHDWEDAEYDKQFMNAASGGLNYYFCRFCYALVQVSLLLSSKACSWCFAGFGKGMFFIHWLYLTDVWALQGVQMHELLCA